MLARRLELERAAAGFPVRKAAIDREVRSLRLAPPPSVVPVLRSPTPR